jgi:hypothetical protein
MLNALDKAIASLSQARPQFKLDFASEQSHASIGTVSGTFWFYRPLGR